MAGVDHAYQYSVEVKSRFSLFMDDALNNEDPDLLISKLRNERVEKVKKDKLHTTPIARSDVKNVEKEPEPELKQEVNQTKGKQVRMPKFPKPTTPAQEENAEAVEHVEKSEAVSGPAFRGRGGSRGFPRGFRGNRGPRQYHAESSHNGVDEHPPRDSVYEPRGRGRSRPRGGFARGRGMSNTDYRETSGQLGADVNHDRHTDEHQSTWKDPDAQHVAPDAQEDAADVTADDTGVTEENHEGGDKDSSAEEPKSYTLKEYKALQSQSKHTITLASKGNRKANDGQDVFANMVAHRKTIEVSDDDIEEVEREEEEPQKFEINFSFNDEFGGRGRQNRGLGNHGFSRGGGGFRGSRPRSERGSRGVRGSFRGENRGRGYQRGAPPQGGYTPVIYNDQEFPSLK